MHTSASDAWKGVADAVTDEAVARVRSGLPCGTIAVNGCPFHSRFTVVMPVFPAEDLKDAHVLQARPPRQEVDPFKVNAAFVEEEFSRHRRVESTATLLLANRECPFRCIYCDLWKQTTTFRVPGGAIPRQIDSALAELPPAKHIKLYNSGNFFDAQAIPPEDYVAIIQRVQRFDTVIVENHPRLCGPVVTDFARALGTQMEVAMGLETIHPEVLPRLNKRMTLEDFDSACDRLRPSGILIRVFLMLRPPFLSEAEGVEWAIRSAEYAFDRGADCVSLIPARGGNGLLERLASQGLFAPPSLEAVETAFDQLLALRKGRVFVDLWNASTWTQQEHEAAARIARLERMNRTQIPEQNLDINVHSGW